MTENVKSQIMKYLVKCVFFYETLCSANHVCDDNIDNYLDAVNSICNLRNDEKRYV